MLISFSLIFHVKNDDICPKMNRKTNFLMIEFWPVMHRVDVADMVVSG